jgi:hypothetical protein
LQAVGEVVDLKTQLITRAVAAVAAEYVQALFQLVRVHTQSRLAVDRQRRDVAPVAVEIHLLRVPISQQSAQVVVVPVLVM